MTDPPKPQPDAIPQAKPPRTLNFGTWRVAGLMSGTSLDGLDVAICRFDITAAGRLDNWQLEHFSMTPFEPALRAQLTALADEQASAVVWHEVARAFALANAEAVSKALAEAGGHLDLVCSSGQTIHHRPAHGWTAQLDSPAHLHAALGGVPVVADLRALDVALGGQGAPLVPLADRDLFSGFSGCLNLGGFSNISFDDAGRRVAFDVGPCNMLLNHLAALHFGVPYDVDGERASAGRVAEGVAADLAQCINRQRRGESWSREGFEDQIQPFLARPPFARLSGVDQLATATRAVALSLSNLDGGPRVLVTGGGARNATLMAHLARLQPTWVVPADERLIDAKEALAWGYLGLRRALGLPNTLREVTGARQALPGGAMWGHLR